MKEFVPEAEVDAEDGQRTPGNKGCSGKHRLVVCGIDRCQENRHKADDAQQDAVEQHAILQFAFIGLRLPE